MRLNRSHIILNTASVEEAKAWIEANDPNYFTDYEGDVVLVCDNPHRWEKTIQNPRPVTSTLLDPGVLGFHLLAEIKNNEVFDKETLQTWFSRTLANIQLPVDNELLQEVFTQLTKWGMLYIQNGVFKITRLGRVSAMLYFFPADVYHWASNFSKVDAGDLWESDLALAYIIGTTPSLDLPYVPRSEAAMVEAFTAAVEKIWPKAEGKRTYLKQSVIAAKVYDWLSQGETSPQVRNIQYDGERICGALEWIDGIKGWQQAAYWKALPMRLKYGVGAELVGLCSIKGVGAVKARKLFAHGITSVEDVLNKRDAVRAALGAGAQKVFGEARTLLKQKE